MSTERDWYVKDYAQDIHNYLRSREGKRCFYKKQSPQLSERKSLIEWIGSVCEKMEFCTTVHHLAIYFFDIFMDNHTIRANHMHMVALGCLIVAVKLEEKDSLIPKNSEFNALIGNRYQLQDFVQMEVTILNFFDWDILLPTAAHFVEYYAIFALSATDKHEGKPIYNLEHMKMYVQKYIEYFLDTTLQDIVYYNFFPSLIAAACILSTRLALKLAPPWPVTLQNITCYKYAQLKSCADIMLRCLDTDILNSKTIKTCSTAFLSEDAENIPEKSDCMLES